MKHLLSIRDLGRDDVPRLFTLTAELKARQKARDAVTPLKGRTMALVFEKPSLRTRVTFEVGMAQLGGASVYLAGQDIGLPLPETLMRFLPVVSNARVPGRAVLVDSCGSSSAGTFRNRRARHDGVLPLTSL